MLIVDQGAEGVLFAKLTDALAGSHHQLVDVTDQNTIIELGGARAREMLMKLTTLDLHQAKFAAGDTAGSMFGRVSATLHMQHDGTNGAAPRFEIIVRRSFADYLWCLLADAGREFGLPE